MALWSSTKRAWSALLLLLALGAIAVGSVNASAAGGLPPTAHASGVESTIVRCTNRARAARGLPGLHRNHILRRAAKYHARNMLRYGFFGHRDVFGNSPLGRISRFGGRRAFRVVGENIAVGYWSPSDACRAWLGSPHHLANILDRRFTMVGVGSARGPGGRTYYVQDFGAPRR